MLWLAARNDNKRQIYRCGYRRGKFYLRFLCLVPYPLHRRQVVPQVYPFFFFESCCEPVYHRCIYVRSTKMRVPACRKHLIYAFAYVHNGNVKSATTKVENRDFILPIFAQSIRHCRCCRLVYYPFYIEARYLSRIFRRLSLVVIEIRRCRDNGSIYLLA